MGLRKTANEIFYRGNIMQTTTPQFLSIIQVAISFGSASEMALKEVDNIDSSEI